MKAIYDEEPTDEAVDNYWKSLNVGKEKESGNKFVTPDGYIITEDPDVRRTNPEAMTWDEYTNMLKNKQEKPFITPDGYTITNRSDKLRSDPKAMTWKMYTNMLAENERLANRYKVLPDGAVIS